MTGDTGERIIGKARELGATMAGIADVARLRESPSHQYLSRFGQVADGIPATRGKEDFIDVAWPPEARSAAVIAVSHPAEEPHLDWFETSGNTPGNRILIKINRDLSAWIEETLNIKTHKMSYYVERHGIYLKDAAVLAGLGCLGRNNMLVTPTLGARVRLRALLLEADPTPTGPIDFFPCEGCDEPCRSACPRDAFANPVPPTESARDGHFSRSKCRAQMDLENETSRVTYVDPTAVGLDTEKAGDPSKYVEHCRACEFLCPVGA